MYSKNDRVIITSEDEMLLTGKVVSTSNNNYIIHPITNNKYIAVNYDINTNKAKFITENKKEVVKYNLTISEINNSNKKQKNSNVFVEEILFDKEIAIVNCKGKRIKMNIDSYKEFIDF